VGALFRSTLGRVLRALALAGGSLACLALAGCDGGDPLEAIRQQQASGDFQGSLESLRELLEANPERAEAHYLYGRALVLTEQVHLAGWSLRRAMEDPDWLIPAGLQLAQIGLAHHDFNEVDEITGRILEVEPENTLALLMRANAHAHWKKDPERALADAERVLELAPDFLAANEPRILALIALDRKPEAREALAEAGRRLVELDADPAVLAWHCSTTAIFQLDAGDVEGARKKWGECLETYPEDPGVVSGAMNFHDSQGELERSLEIARAAHARAPGSQAFRATLVGRLVLAGRAAEAEALLREAARSPEPGQAAGAWLELGQMRQRLGEYDAAAEAIGEAIEQLRRSGRVPPKLEFDYADTLVVAGRLEQALGVAEGFSVPAYRHLIRARVAQERRQPAEALREFEAGLKLWPDNPFARYYAAVAAEELGDFERALAEYRYAVRDDPDATDARTRGAALLLAEGKLPSALDLLFAGTGRGSGLELEGQLLALRIHGALGNQAGLRTVLDLFEKSAPGAIGLAYAAAAEGVALRGGTAAALELLKALPRSDYERPRYAAALRAFVRLAREAGDGSAAQAALRAALAAHPDLAAFQEIRGLDLELSGAPREAARAAYTRAVELQPGNPHALAALGRLALADDPAAALDYFERAAAADPSDPEPKLEAARALVASGKLDEAAERLDALLLKHPHEGEAAAERARLDLERGTVTAGTLERAQRAVRFRGGADAFDLLSQVHEKLGEPEAAAQAAERARTLRETKPQVEG
jgi:tetratricopeptide (TPR) repeat protein